MGHGKRHSPEQIIAKVRRKNKYALSSDTISKSSVKLEWLRFRYC